MLIRAGISILLFLFIVFARLANHMPNLAPVATFALFLSFLCGRKQAVAAVLGGMLISDIFLGFYEPLGMAFNYIGLLVPAFFGKQLQKQTAGLQSVAALFGMSLVGSVAFFLFSNFGTFVSTTLYAHTWVGLVRCYQMAVPFFRTTVQGDLLYNGLIFGGYALVLSLLGKKNGGKLVPIWIRNH